MGFHCTENFQQMKKRAKRSDPVSVAPPRVTIRSIPHRMLSDRLDQRYRKREKTVFDKVDV